MAAVQRDRTGSGERLRRRLAGGVVLVGMALLVGRHFARQPAELTVVYHLGAAREGLRRLDVRYLRGEEQVRRVSYRYRGGAAPLEQPHSVELVDGTYTVIIDLTYGEIVSSAIRTRKERIGPRAVRLRRSLSVSDSGRATIFIADEL